MANYQQMDTGRHVVYIDAENTLDPDWARKLGVDVDAMVIIQPESESAEELFEMASTFIETGEVGLIIIDSLGALVSAQEMNKTIEDKTYGGISLSLTQFSKKAEMLCKKNACTVICINQLRDDFQALWAGATKTVGGRAWRHMCSVKLEFRRGSFLDERGNEIKKSSESPAGNVILMSMIKNKTCPPNRRGGFYSIDYANGINYLRDLVDVAMKYDVVHQTGAWYTVINPETGEFVSEKINGMAKVYEYLEDEEHEDVLTFIENYIESKI